MIVKAFCRGYNRCVQTRLAFTKMHGLGNDFVVIDARELPEYDWSALSRAICDRHLGVGADQLLLVGRSGQADVSMRLFNTDGFEAEMCGNGIRCIGKYVFERGIVDTPDMYIETLGGVKKLHWLLAGQQAVGASVCMADGEMMMTGPASDVFEGRWPVRA